MKICKKCLLEKPTTDFRKNNHNKDGLDSFCRVCRSAYMKEYRHRPDRVIKQREYQKRFDSREKPKIVKSQYYEKHKVYISIRSKKYRADPQNRARINELQKRYDQRVKRSKRTLRRKDWLRILALQNNKCYICGIAFTEDIPPVRDHIIPVTAGGDLTRANIQALCACCNCKKHKNSPFGKAIDILL